MDRGAMGERNLKGLPDTIKVEKEGSKLRGFFLSQSKRVSKRIDGRRYYTSQTKERTSFFVTIIQFTYFERQVCTINGSIKGSMLYETIEYRRLTKTSRIRRTSSQLYTYIYIYIVGKFIPFKNRQNRGRFMVIGERETYKMSYRLIILRNQRTCLSIVANLSTFAVEASAEYKRLTTEQTSIQLPFPRLL